jgi:hypothetical protein
MQIVLDSTTDETTRCSPCPVVYGGTYLPSLYNLLLITLYLARLTISAAEQTSQEDTSTGQDFITKW